LFNVDPKLLARISCHVGRVLIVDANLAFGRLLGELMKEIGARTPIYATQSERAFEICADFDPQVIFTEVEGPEIDGVAFTRGLRHSGLSARKTPVVVTATQPREGVIKAARDAGAHEFLVKPFTAGHLLKRVANVTLKPRLWIEARHYVGPDRRRFCASEFTGAPKRRTDEAETQRIANIFAAAEISFRQHLALYDLEPQQALRGMLVKSAEMQGAAFQHSNPDLASAVSSLMGYLALTVERGALNRAVIENHITAVRALRDPVNQLDASSRARLLLRLSNMVQANAA
jgi:CheY-like chemotaxis protein